MAATKHRILLVLLSSLQTFLFYQPNPCLPFLPLLPFLFNSSEWAYWELEDDKRRDVVWMDIIRKMFDFTTVEEFHQCLMYQPKIS